MALKTNWETMSLGQRLTAAAVDCMQHPEFALLSGVLMMGKVITDVDAVTKGQEMVPITTAGTDGLDCYYSAEFMAKQNRQQHRWVILHENFHKALHHCTEYLDLVEKYGMLCNIAQDFVINAMIDEIDPQQKFAKQPSGIEICLDKKYYGWSWIDVLRDLLRNAKKISVGGNAQGQGQGDGQGQGKSFDVHIPNAQAKQANGDGKGSDQARKEMQQMKQRIQDALYQGKMTVERMAGKGKGTSPLDALTKKRVTDWKTPLREFIEQICAGYDNSRFCPPNRRLLALGILMPSHFSEATGEIHVYCDTSGSMTHIYPVVFGEIARIAEHVKPSALRVIWWDGEVQSEQTFTEGNYDQITSLIQPSGGGGTTPMCVVRYLEGKNYKPRAGIWLTDGYLDGSNPQLPWPVLWGVVDNENFVAPQGKKIDIQSNL